MSRARARGVLGGNTRCCVHLSGSHSATPRTEPGVTELSGLTSDPVLTADRRGGILISFGPHRTPFDGINPSKAPGGSPIRAGTPAETGSNGFPCRLLFAFVRTLLFQLRASGRRAGGRFRPAVRIPLESRWTDKPVGSAALCAPVTRFLRPTPVDGRPSDRRISFPVPKGESRGSSRIARQSMAETTYSGNSENAVARLEADPSSRACASGRVGCLAAHSPLVPPAESSTDRVGRTLRALRGVRSPVSRRWPR